MYKFPLTLKKYIQSLGNTRSPINNSIFYKTKKFFYNLSIGKKISYSYCLAISVGLTGTTVGLLLGDYYQDQALSKLRISDKQQSAIIELESALTNLRAYPQQLMTVLGDPISLDYEKVKFFENINRIKQQIQQFEILAEQFSSHITINTEDINFLENADQTTIKRYVDWIESWESELNIMKLSAKDIPAAQQQIWDYSRTDTATDLNREFDRISEHLTQLHVKAEAQHNQSNLQFKKANLLRFYIVFGSILFSAIMTLVLSLLTSAAIAHPIRRLTQVAQDITENSNFSLRVPVQSQDEVGRLSQSLNKLIQWIETYTDELEQAHQTLEEKVEKRTQALQQTLQELKTTQTQLIHTEKMSSLGQMVAGVAHEINNPINFIYANIAYIDQYINSIWDVIKAYQTEYSHPSESLQNLIEDTDLEFIQADLDNILNSMRTGSHRIRDIVVSLRTFSRLDEAEMKSVDLHAGIESTLLLLKHRLGVQKDSPPLQIIRQYGTLPPVNCYASQLNQVFMNILNNGIDALHAKQLTHQQPTLTIQTQNISQTKIQILITDNGIGMDEATLNHIFDPFFTTKPVGSGTGLGLSTSYQIIVEQHQGRLSCTSSLGKGTTFIIEIPL